jgi:hypothetical protein
MTLFFAVRFSFPSIGVHDSLEPVLEEFLNMRRPVKQPLQRTMKRKTLWRAGEARCTLEGAYGTITRTASPTTQKVLYVVGLARLPGQNRRYLHHRKRTRTRKVTLSTGCPQGLFEHSGLGSSNF